MINTRVLKLSTIGGIFPVSSSDWISRKEDFYEMQRLQQIPSYDVLITNPPYSDDHINRLLTFATNCNKPYFLLMPNFVYAKVMSLSFPSPALFAWFILYSTTVFHYLILNFLGLLSSYSFTKTTILYCSK